MVQGPRARAAWCVLDAQWFGVAQRRRRVFVVVDFGNCIDPAAILLEPDRLRGNTPPRRETGKGPARGFETGPHGGGFAEVAPTLDTSCKDGPVRAQIGAGVITARMTAFGEYACDGTASTVKQRDFKDATDLVVGATGRVTHALTAEGHDASEDGTGRGTPVVAFDTTQITSPQNVSNPKPGDACHPLAAGAHPPALFLPAVRRLAPTECHRLQGFPDDWCAITRKGKPAADGPQYKALSNSMAVPVIAWILDRLRVSWEQHS
ncbi:DNA cytosine methyltransferase [Shimia sp. R9_2]|nr:DNA cytosine methyltransferase [Shimia sp. R9_2]